MSLTEIVYILDRSGSMSGLEEDTIGGFNAMLVKQKKTGEKAYVSTVLFDNKCEVLHDRVPIEEVKAITDKEYYVRGCTALLDAIGGAIYHIGNAHKYARNEDRPTKTIFVITTDGLENASRTYSYEKVKSMISYEQEKYGWEFIFVGANIDAAKEAGRLGIRRERSVNYVHDSIGTKTIFTGLAEAVCVTLKANNKEEVEERLNKNTWKETIENDFMVRAYKGEK